MCLRATRFEMDLGVRSQHNFCASRDTKTWLSFRLILQRPSMFPLTSMSEFVFLCFLLMNVLTLSLSDPMDMKTTASTEWSSPHTGRNNTQTNSPPTRPFVNALQRWLLVFVFMCVCVYAPSQQLVSRAGKGARVFYKWACTKRTCPRSSGGRLSERGLRAITREMQE